MLYVMLGVLLLLFLIILFLLIKKIWLCLNINKYIYIRYEDYVFIFIYRIDLLFFEIVFLLLGFVCNICSWNYLFI